MMRHDEMFDEISEDHMAELLERTIQRGTRLRRRTMALRVSLAALVISAVAVPLGLSFSQQQGPPSSAAIAVTSGTAFQDVVWKHVDYPGLNFSKVTFPGNIGCNPGSAYGFTVDVQQVSYIRSAQGTQIALVLVKCDAGTPTPSSLYAFTVKPGSSKPQLLQTLRRSARAPGTGVLVRHRVLDLRGCGGAPLTWCDGRGSHLLPERERGHAMGSPG